MKFRVNENRKGIPLTVKDLLSDFAKESNMGDAFEINFIKQKWENIVGNIMATHSYPDRVFGKVLFVKADHPVFANDIAMMKNMIIKKINDVSDIKINDIKVEIKKFSTKRRG